jgi:hypothetical protein
MFGSSDFGWHSIRRWASGQVAQAGDKFIEMSPITHMQCDATLLIHQESDSAARSSRPSRCYRKPSKGVKTSSRYPDEPRTAAVAGDRHIHRLKAICEWFREIWPERPAYNTSSSVLSEPVARLLRDDDEVLDTDAALVLEVHPRFESDHVARFQNALGVPHQARVFVDLHSHAVAQAVAEALALPRRCDHAARRAVRLAAVEAGPQGAEGCFLGLAHQRIALAPGLRAVADEDRASCRAVAVEQDAHVRDGLRAREGVLVKPACDERGAGGDDRRGCRFARAGRAILISAAMSLLHAWLQAAKAL